MGAPRMFRIALQVGDLEAAGALAVDEQPISLEEALIAHVGRQGDNSLLLM